MSTLNSKLPDQITMLCSLKIEAAGGSDKQLPQFSMIAYTGGLMRITGFPHPVVVDLEGLAVERQDIPVRLDHNPRQGVGHTQHIAVENGQVTAEGLISRDTSWARDVARSGVNGFPWQASIGAAVVEAEFVPVGQHATVNGRTFDGPIHVVRQAILKEISFVDSGADANTAARIAANDKEHSNMKETKTAADAQDTTAAEEAAAHDEPKAPTAEPTEEPAPKAEPDAADTAGQESEAPAPAEQSDTQTPATLTASADPPSRTSLSGMKILRAGSQIWPASRGRWQLTQTVRATNSGPSCQPSLTRSRKRQAGAPSLVCPYRLAARCSAHWPTPGIRRGLER